MKKILMVCFSLLLSKSSFASEVFAFCATEFPSTSFEIDSTKDLVTTKVFNHNGQLYAPFWNSLVVPNDFEQLKQKSDLVMKLQSTTITNWKTNNCKWYGDKKFACVGSDEKINSNGVVLEPWALYSTLIKDSSFAGDYDYVEMTLSFYVNQEQHQIVMRYQASECEISDHQITRKK